MATAVQLNIVVDEKGGIAGLERFRTAEKAAVGGITADMQQMGAQTEVAGQKGQSAFRGIESATLRARLAERVLIQELGIELPGVLTKVAAKSQALGPIFAGVFGATIFTAAIGALGGIANKIIEVTDRMGGYTEAVKAMEQETIKASRQAFLSPETVDVTFKHLQEINDRIVELNKKRQQAAQVEQKVLTVNPFAEESGYQSNSPTQQENDLLDQRNKLDKQDVDLRSQQTALTEHLKDLTKDIVASADAEAATAGLQGFAKIAADRASAINAINEKAGSNQAVAQQLIADKEKVFSAQSVALARQSSQATLALRHQVTDETLADEQKIREDEKFSIQELDALRRQSLITRQDYEQRSVLIHQQANNKIKALDIEILKIQQDADNFVLEQKAHSLTGEERLYADRNLKIKQLEDQLGAIRSGPITEKGLAQMKAISEKEIAIIEETENEVTELRKEGANKRTLILEQAGEQQRDAETAASLATVEPWQRAYAQIVVESNKRLEQIDKEERNQLANQKLTSDEVVAISSAADARREQVHAETNQKIIEENKRLADQLGSELESVFNDISSGNIGKRILQNMEKLFFDILAQWIISLGVMKSQAGGILGSIVFGPGSTGANVFGGGGNLFGGALGGGLFGSGGTPPFIPPGIFSGGSSTLPGGTAVIPPGLPGSSSGASATGDFFGSSLGGIFGQGSNTASTAITSTAATSSTAGTTTSLGLSGLFGQSSSLSSVIAPSGPLSTQSLSSILGEAHDSGNAAGASVGGAGGGLLGLGKLLSPNGLLGLGAAFAPVLGGLAGGKVGQIGGLFSSLLLTAVLNPTGPIAGLLAHLGLGIGGPLALAAGPIAGGLLGLGIGLQHGGLAGGLSGGLSGAAIGFLFGGPIGAIIGGIVGLLGGVFGGILGGSKRKKQANSFVDSTVLPDIKKIVDSYESFQLDFAGANKQLDDLDTQAKANLDKLKGEGKGIFAKRVQPAIDDAKKEIKGFENERTRRSSLTFGPPQFHEGGFVSSTFSSFVSRPGELMAVLKHGEFVVNPQSTARNLQTLERMNSGGTISGDMHFYAPLIQAQRVDEAWLRNGGAQQILDALRRARYEGLR